MGNGNDLTKVPVTALRGVGPALSKGLAERGIESVWDLFRFIPVRYEERPPLSSLAEIRDGDKVVVAGRVKSWRFMPVRWGRLKIFEALISDDDGRELSLKWFRWNKGITGGIGQEGNSVVVAGRVTLFSGTLQIVHPDILSVGDGGSGNNHGGPVPVYPQVGKIKAGTLRRIISDGLDRYGDDVETSIPKETVGAYGLDDLKASLRAVHLPEIYGGVQTALRGRSRLVLEEFFQFHVSLLAKRAEARQEKGISFGKEGLLRSRFVESLPFRLTKSQQKSIGEIERDMVDHSPMNRLLQGDVGSGKTVCAVMAVCRALDNGFQAAFLAPTEILAEQHYYSIHPFFRQIGCEVGFLRGGLRTGERKILVDRIRSGEVAVVVGTHALLHKDVHFARLGLIIIDEQQRFGVFQRRILPGRGTTEQYRPDVLVMSATPIPRTLSMVLHGDIDVSTIDELPAGRKPVVTEVFGEKDRETVYRAVREELERGRQAFLVYPLVEESDTSDLPAAETMIDDLASGAFRDFRLGILHGRMKPETKEAQMASFTSGLIDALVCTTVIEVGIDVPNATMIVIDHAERFGLAQLHQLRGRVGRGEEGGRCFLIAGKDAGSDAKKRLMVLTRTTDGFVVAEKDLAIRGPGEILGERQAGFLNFSVGDPVRDGEIMALARIIAESLSPIHSGGDRIKRMEGIGGRRQGEEMDGEKVTSIDKGVGLV